MHLVKRGGHVEDYDERKLYASVYAAALAVHEPAGSAELIAQEVTKQVEKWMHPKHVVTSNDIRRVASQHLQTINEHVAVQYMYHRILS